MARRHHRPSGPPPSEHFIDLCRLLGEPTPTEADPTGTWYAFEKGAEKLGGGDGFADVWKRGFFAWEYKGKRKDLKAAYLQLHGYRDALENPPLLVVSDLERIEVHTNFTSLSPLTYVVTLDDLAAADPSEPLAHPAGGLHRARGAPPARSSRPRSPRRPPATFAELAWRAPRARPRPAGGRPLPRPDPVLPVRRGRRAPARRASSRRLADATRGRARALFATALGELFGRMAHGGGMFGAEQVDWFNGGLFDSADVLPLTGARDRDAPRGRRASTGRSSSRRSSGPSSSAASTPTGGPSSAPTTPAREQIWRLVEPVVIRPAAPRVRRDAGAGDRAPPVPVERSRRRTRPERTRSRSSGPSSTDSGGSACSTPPAARATSSTSPSGRSRISSSRRSTGARSSCGRRRQFPGSAPRRSWASRSTPTPPSWPG